MDINKLTYELIKDLLPEIGEGTAKGYPYIKNHDVLELDDGEYLWGTVVYNFTPPSGLDYSVVINYDYDPEEHSKEYEPGDKLLNIAKIDFSAEESYEATNRQELYNIMTTIGEILKEEFNRPEVKGRLDAIQYMPALGKSRNVKPGENLAGGTQRDRLYLAYIKKAVPTGRVEHIRDKYAGKVVTRVHLKESHKGKSTKLAAKSNTESTVEETYKGKKTNNGAPGTFKAKITKAYGGDVTIEKARKFKNRENATALDKQQANWFINFHSKNENLNEIGDASAKVYPFTSDIDPSKLVDIAKKFHETNTSTVYFDTKLVYKFKTDKANYDVGFHVVMERKRYANITQNPNWKPGPPYKTYAAVGFNIEGDTEEKSSNLNEQFSVLSTVTKIIFDFIDNVNASGGNLVSLQVAPKSDVGTRSKLDSKRGKFYAAYIKKNLSKLSNYDAKEGKNAKGYEYIEIYKKNLINELVTDTEVICDKCGWTWKIADGGEDVYTCHNTLPGGSVCGHNNDPDLFETPNPEAGSAIPYGSGYRAVKERLNEDLYSVGGPADSPVGSEPEVTMQDKLEPYLIEITQYMYRQGLNIDPAPEIEFVEDQENAQNVLGKTAYYDPTTRTIVLYTTGRHPKDILRSFTHEMIHHMQNLEGRLENMSGTTNVNEDGYLANIEREAYDNGNMIFRSWENDREGNNSIHNMRGFTPGSYDMQPSDSN
jgi:hypothetical protein